MMEIFPIPTPDCASCLICQEGESRSEKLSQGTVDGKKKIQHAAAERSQLKDHKSLPILNRLKSISEEDWACCEFRWHKTCYINFASESRLSRLRNRGSKENLETTTQLVEESSAKSSCYRTRQQGNAVVDWAHCILCQQSGKADVHNIMTMKMSQKIIDLAKEDAVMSVRMANVVDLIAAEGKYHTKCYINLERRVNVICCVQIQS